MAIGILGSIAGAVLPGIVPSIQETIKGIIAHYLPDPVAQAQAQIDLTAALNKRDELMIQALAQMNTAQTQVNAVEAASPSFFKGGWRPAVAWVCVFGMFYNFILAPISTWALAIIGTAAGIAIPVPPTLDTQSLWAILTGMLGLAGIRSYEVSNGISPPDVPLLKKK
jgi:hypothetical protein